MNYQDTLDWMFAQLPMYQRQGTTAFKKDLTNILAFSKELNYPEKKFKSIHVGGTNGKGSTSHMLASVLQEAGYKVGLYTSPHLKNFTERIRINGEEVSKEYVVGFITTHKRFLEHQGLSFFEMTVGMAFQYFAQESVDIGIIEVGLGGRLDSTNILNPEVSVITNIGYDHMQFLGETLPEIASEKAGIIKHKLPVVVGEYQEEVAQVFLDKAKAMHTHVYFASELESDYSTDLLGAYQAKNAKTAVRALQVLNGFTISNDTLERGLMKVVENTNLKGRWQILNASPKVICDTAHNKEGLQFVMRQLLQEDFENLHIVLGVVNDKKLESLLSYFPQNATYYFCKPAIPRGLNERELSRTAKQFDLLGEEYESVTSAYEYAIQNAGTRDIIYVGGSTFVVAEVI